MKNKRIKRIFQHAGRCYQVNIKKNIFTSLTIGTSVLLFLVAALYLDFGYATYVNNCNKIPKKCIPVMFSDNLNMKTLQEEIASKDMQTVQRYDASGNLVSKNGRTVSLNYNLLAVQTIPSNKIHNGIDYFESDPDGTPGAYFDSFKIIAGRSQFQEDKELVISEEYCALLGMKAREVLGTNVVLCYGDNTSLFKIVGVFKPLLREKQYNNQYFKNLKENAIIDDNNSEVLVTAFIPQDVFPGEYCVGTDNYIFYSDGKKYRYYKEKMDKLMEKITVNMECVTADDLKLNKNIEWYNVVKIKMYMLLMLSVLSGISVFGTMFNSIYDRRKEIGIKRVVGANDKDILVSLIIENSIVAIVASMMAIYLAAIASLNYTYYQRQILMNDYCVQFYSSTIILFTLFTFSMVVGFSLIPAYEATQLNVIDALRDET